MACITFIAPLVAMATTQLAREIRYQDASIWQAEGNLEHNSLRMSWVVVTEENGNRQLRMQWAAGKPR
jgi:hypothetical protein